MSKRYYDRRLREQLKLSRMLLTAQIAHTWSQEFGPSVREVLERAKAEITAAIYEVDERIAK